MTRPRGALLSVEECVYWLWLVQRYGNRRNVYDEIEATVTRDVPRLRRLIRRNLRLARDRYDEYCPPFWQFEATLVMLCRAAVRAVAAERAAQQ